MTLKAKKKKEMQNHMGGQEELMKHWNAPRGNKGVTKEG